LAVLKQFNYHSIQRANVCKASAGKLPWLCENPSASLAIEDVRIKTPAGIGIRAVDVDMVQAMDLHIETFLLGQKH